MKFNYIASQPDGKIVENQIDAKDVSEVLQFLSTRGLKPVSVKPVSRSDAYGLGSGKINLTDQIFISKYLSLMLRLGTGLLQAINILLEDFDKKSVKSFLMEVRSNLERGQPFYSAFSRYPKVFSQVYVNLIRAG
ncbi:type II secretion system F family protein, partial [Patescibacteria group bacterium]|nr:type II secretion system F family protein [Patescibacteria group bacterium]